VSESDVAYLDTMDEVLELVLYFAECARHTQDDVALDNHLKMASRSLRCALEMHGEHLAQRAGMKQGEPVNENLPSGIDPQ
jgi:hypothetical protein